MNGKNIGKLKKKMLVIEAATTLLFISLTSGNVLGNNDIINKNGIQQTNANDLSKTEDYENYTQISNEEVNESLSNYKYFNYEYYGKNVTILTNLMTGNMNISEWLNKIYEKLKENSTFIVQDFLLFMAFIFFSISTCLSKLAESYSQYAQILILYANFFMTLGWICLALSQISPG